MTPDINEQLRLAYEVVRLSVAILFAASFLFAGTALVSPDSASPRRPELCFRGARLAYLIGSFLLGALLVLSVFQPSASTPVLVNVGVSGIVAVFALSLERMRPNASAGLSFLSAALIWLLNVITPYLFPQEQKSLVGTDGVVWLHVVTAIAGEATCLIAFLTSAVYLWNHSRLKARTLSKPPLGPGLDTLDRLTRHTTLLGLLLLTMSLISGLMLVSARSGEHAVGAPKVVWAFATWAFYVLLIFGRGFWNWRGRNAARLTLAGTSLVFLGLFGSFA